MEFCRNRLKILRPSLSFFLSLWSFESVTPICENTVELREFVSSLQCTCSTMFWICKDEERSTEVDTRGRTGTTVLLYLHTKSWIAVQSLGHLCVFGVSKEPEFLYSLFCRCVVVEISTANKTEEQNPHKWAFSFSFNYYSYSTLTLQNLETIDSSGKLLKHSIN